MSRFIRLWLLVAILVSATYASTLVEVHAQKVWVWTDRYYYNVGDTVFIYMRSSVTLTSSRLTITHSNGYQSQTWLGAMAANVIRVYYGTTAWSGYRYVVFEGWWAGGLLKDATSYVVYGVVPPPPPTTVTQTTTVTTTTAPPDFKIDVTPPSSSVKLGEMATFTVTVSSIGGFSSDVYLEVSGSPAIPPGSSFVTPNPVKPPADDSQRATLTINTKNFDSSGTYTLTVSGRSGSLVRTAVVQLDVKFSITISVMPESQIVKQGDSTYFTIHVDVGEYKGTVSITVSGIPAGAAKTVSPTSLVGSGPATLTVTTSDQTPVGTHSIQVTATAGGMKAHGQALLTVRERPLWERTEMLVLALILVVALAAIGAWAIFRRKPAPPATVRRPAATNPAVMRPSVPGPATAESTQS